MFQEIVYIHFILKAIDDSIFELYNLLFKEKVSKNAKHPTRFYTIHVKFQSDAHYNNSSNELHCNRHVWIFDSPTISKHMECDDKAVKV